MTYIQSGSGSKANPAEKAPKTPVASCWSQFSSEVFYGEIFIRDRIGAGDLALFGALFGAGCPLYHRRRGKAHFAGDQGKLGFCA
jgi:hypothetical protein